ncbi:glycosyltransferase [Romeria aff. gracilis LEGE 07310]|uniref:Glycosyltransferase n=1 Tax=Vasconcelosia minhoensis LEGE 07310 TaxID=915328 RepID=A0A8J7AM59_9CYAN|nr:glycosyltransferase [Romeria gracilis]MBE9076974.1 glycosyltransferase [Romeria aff. gracilis LEGE 07310]
MALISVIIPAYNSERTIAETVESVIQQTLTDFEIIVIDDGSTDRTLERLDAIEDCRLTVVSQKNSGVSASRNLGIAKASGQYIAFLDADDLWLPDKLAAQVQALAADPAVAVAYSWVDYIDESGQFLRSGMHSTIAGDVYERIVLGSFLESGSNPLIRKTAIDHTGGFDETLRTAEDWEMWVRLAAQYRFAVVPQVQVLYRVSSRSKSFRLENHRSAGLAVIDRVFAQTPDSFQRLKPKALASFYKYLTFKVLSAPEKDRLGRKEAMFAAGCLFRSVAYNPAMLKQTRVLLSALFKIAKLSLISNRPSEKPS